ncbi:MAG: phosphatidylserine/phosphatidylglycerophosphate/cardiolipin synthase family protein, partial [Rhodothermales bacterium]|nr:phosphatidylserine/phosphatidylglycerophosphate/cardiolipin synthase family protein [Rhodothermales bacterium]
MSSLLAFQTKGSPGGTSVGNELTLRPDAAEMLEVLLGLIRSASDRIWLEVYIFESDQIGKAVTAELVTAARRGCEVVVLIDGWGGRKFPSKARRHLVDAGVSVAFYNPVWFLRKRGRRIASGLHRDHRKIMVIDDVAFVGGRNISEEYLGDRPTFQDLSLQIRGPAVRDIATLFVSDWLSATGEEISLPASAPQFSGGIEVSVIELDQRQGYPDLDLTIRNTLSRTKENCRIVTPYFVPPQWFLDEIFAALDRGVEVQILTAGRSDVPMARSAGRHLYDRLLQRGARVYELKGIVLHAKSITFDDSLCVVGSYNIDAYGSRHNLEVGVAASSTSLVRALNHQLDAALGQS